MPGFNLADYEPVEERLARFWVDHPKGRVYTELVNGSHAGESVIMIARVYKDSADTFPAATGHAQETPGSNPVNKTSWIENCETSAIGRALANMGYAPKGSRPSREEMAKVAAPSKKPPPAGSRTPPKKLRASQISLLEACKQAGINDDLRHRLITMLMSGSTSSVKDLDDEECDHVKAQIVLFASNLKGNMRVLEQWEAKR